MPVGDMFIVLGHETKTRYDAKAQAVTTRTEYFVPCAKNTREEAADFVKEVKGCYHADIVQLWNPRHERTCHMFVSPECEQQWADSTAYYCSACGHGNLDPIVGGYCRYCGARVVTA